MKRDLLYIVFTAVVFAALIVCFASCKVHYQLPISSSDNRRDSERIEYVHDSIYIDRVRMIYIGGDTVYIRDSVNTVRTQKQTIHDSIYINLTDTIYQPTETKTATMSKGTVFLRNSGIALYVILSILFLSVVVGLIFKFAK